ncbi:hypothetical protein N9E77_01455 [Candidatus Pelagibacter sp.]|nr:hypothetical protein [Candidatus Pelagibacter sp.]
MQKKIFTLILFLFLSSCGYEAIHSKKNTENYDFSIDKLNFIGQREVNLKIKEKLNNYTLSKNNKKFILNISSTSEKTILAKDTSGDATSFQNKIILQVESIMNNKFKNNFTIIEYFNYNNNSNKFELKKYEREIRNTLAEIASDKLIFKLSNI